MQGLISADSNSKAKCTSAECEGVLTPGLGNVGPVSVDVPPVNRLTLGKKLHVHV